MVIGVNPTSGLELGLLAVFETGVAAGNNGTSRAGSLLGRGAFGTGLNTGLTVGLVAATGRSDLIGFKSGGVATGSITVVGCAAVFCDVRVAVAGSKVAVFLPGLTGFGVLPAAAAAASRSPGFVGLAELKPPGLFGVWPIGCC